MNTMAQSKLFGLAENRTDVWSTPQDFFENWIEFLTLI